MDISLIQPRGQGGTAGNKTDAGGTGGLFAQLLLGSGTAEPPPRQGEPAAEATAQAPASSQQRDSGDRTAGQPHTNQPHTNQPHTNQTGMPAETVPDTALEALLPDAPVTIAPVTPPARETQPILAQPILAQPILAQPILAQPILMGKPPGDAPVSPRPGEPAPTPRPLQPIQPLGAAPPPTPGAAKPGAAKPATGETPPPAPSAPRVAAAAPDRQSVKPTGDAPRPRVAETEPSAPELAMAPDAPVDPGPRADRPVADASRRQARPAGLPTADPAKTARANAAAAAPLQAAGQARVQPQRAQPGQNALAETAPEPGHEPRFGHRDGGFGAPAPAKAPPAEPLPTLGGGKPGDAQAATASPGQAARPGQEAKPRTDLARAATGSKADLLDPLTAAKRLAHGFDLGFLSQASFGSETLAQGFTVSPDGVSLVATQQANPTASIDLTGALPSRGAVIDPGAQIAIQISRAISAQTQRFSIKLDPPELGRIDVRLHFARDGAVRASVAVERPDTLDLLQKDVQSLERALRDAGTDPNKLSLNFSLQGENGGEQTARDENNAQSGAGDKTADDDKETDDRGPDRFRPRADALVDLQV